MRDSINHLQEARRLGGSNLAKLRNKRDCDQYVTLTVLTDLARTADGTFYSQDFINAECNKIMGLRGENAKSWPVLLYHAFGSLGVEDRDKTIRRYSKRGAVIQRQEIAHADASGREIRLSTYRINPAMLENAEEQCRHLHEKIFGKSEYSRPQSP